MIYSQLKGRIGNNLFQIAAGYSLASKLNTKFMAYVPDFILPEPDLCTLKEYLTQFMDNLLRKAEFTEEIPENILKYTESVDLSYRELPGKDNLLLEGYFLSENYFNEILIRDLFSIDDRTEEYIKEKYGDLLNNGVVSINVRRGDYVNQPHLHPVCSMAYYKNAIGYFAKEQEFMIISDDIEWCRRKFRGGNFHFIDDEPPVVDLYLQSKCRNNIISNSTFSWWGAWLNPDPEKTVIAPSENWIGKLHPYKYSEDLLPPEWIKIKNPLDFRLKLIVFGKQIINDLVIPKRKLITEKSRE